MSSIKVTKLTDVDLLRKANSFTTGKESKMTLATAYKTMHTPCRTQLFWVECEEIPLFVASQLVRSHVGVQFFQRSKRIDRDGDDFNVECYDFGQRLDLIAENVDENLTVKEAEGITDALNEMESEVKSWRKRFDRHAPTDLAFICNAEALINMARKRLCAKASAETREIVQKICELVGEQDPDLYPHLVRPCVACGVCHETKHCGYMATDAYAFERRIYKNQFRPKNMMEEQAPYEVSHIANRPTISFDEKSDKSRLISKNVFRFREIVDGMAKMYEKKNCDYGNSFEISVRKYGKIAALTRMSDKFNRIENLILNSNAQVKDESLLDSLKDLACYCVMTVMAIEDNDFENVE